MSDQPLGPQMQPTVLVAVPPPSVPPPVPRKGSGVLRALLIVFLVLGTLGVLLVGGVFLLAGSFSYSPDDMWIEEVHHSGKASSPHKIAIVTVDDIIYEATEKYAIKQLKKAEKDKRVKAVVLKVDSPGGTITASDHIHRKVHQLCRAPKDRKLPVVVSMQGLAASGGYYISVPADKIFAEPTTMTGSIGVIASFPNVAGLMEKWDIRWEVVKTGPMKDTGSPFRPMRDDERERLRQVIDDAYQRFIDLVADGRSGTLDRPKVASLATGDIFTAREAKASGLIDEIGYLEDAIAAAESLAGVTDSNVIEYKRPLSLSDILMGVNSRKPAMSIDLNSIYRAGVPRVMYLTQGPTIGL